VWYTVFSSAADVHIPQEIREDFFEYLISLRCSLIEVIPPVMSAMCGSHKQQLLTAIPKIVWFMGMVWGDVENRTPEIERGLFGILSDFFHYIIPDMPATEVKQFVNNNFVSGLVNYGLSQNNEIKQTALLIEHQMR